MEEIHIMASVLLLPDTTQLLLPWLEFDAPEQTILASARTTATEATFPLCQQASSRVHSHSIRTLADVPCPGQWVRWLIQVRRFRCLHAKYQRKIFTECLPSCTPAYSRRAI